MDEIRQAVEDVSLIPEPKPKEEPIQYRRFKVWIKSGKVERNDGRKPYKNSRGYWVIRDFGGEIRSVSHLVWAAATWGGQESFKRMKNLRVYFKDGNPNNLKRSNLRTELKASYRRRLGFLKKVAELL
jgi:hypothetical protein